MKLLNSRNALISCSACHAIGEIGRNGPLPLPAGLEKMEQGKEIYYHSFSFSFLFLEAFNAADPSGAQNACNTRAATMSGETGRPGML